MAGETSRDSSTPNRWLAVLGGVLMNLCLGAFYGWSLYVPSLEKTLSVTRAQSTNIFSIAVVVFAEPPLKLATAMICSFSCARRRGRTSFFTCFLEFTF